MSRSMTEVIENKDVNGMILLRNLVLISGLCVVCVLLAYNYNSYWVQDDIYLASKDGLLQPVNRVKGDSDKLLENNPERAHIDDALVKLPFTEVGMKLMLTSLGRGGSNGAPREFSIENYKDEYFALDYKRMLPLLFPDERYQTSFVAPFAVTSQQEHVYWFLGLFNFNHQSGTMRTVDSIFIGNRVTILQLAHLEGKQTLADISLAYNHVDTDSNEGAGSQDIYKTFVIESGRIQQVDMLSMSTLMKDTLQKNKDRTGLVSLCQQHLSPPSSTSSTQPVVGSSC